MSHNSFLAITFALTFSGCTTYLNAVHLPASNNGHLKGVVYYLPRSEFDITITRRLRGCNIKIDPNFSPQGYVTKISDTTVVGDSQSKFRTEYKQGDWIVIGHQARKVASTPVNDQQLVTTKAFTVQLLEPLPYGKPADPVPSPDLVAEMSTTVETKTLPDSAQAYLIDYETLASGIKQTNITVDLFDNGTLKGINASLTDKSSEIILSIVKSGVAIAKMVMGIPTPPGALGLPAPLEEVDSPCKNEISQALLELSFLNKKLATHTRQRDAYVQLLKTVTFVMDSAARQNLDNFLKDVENAQKAIDSLSARQKQIIETLSVIERVRFVPQSSQTSQTFFPSDSVLKEWFGDSTGDAKQKLAAVAAVQILVRPPANINGDEKCQTGIVYRNPAHAFLTICQERSCVDNKGNPIPGIEELYRARTVIPQMGGFVRLPLRNGIFQSNTLIASFSQDGVLTKLTFSNEAAAEKASATLAQSLPSISKLLEEQKTADTQNVNLETEKIQAEINREKARREFDQLMKSQ